VTDRTPAEIAAINALVNEFYDCVNRARVDRQIALDALEYAFHDLLVEVCADRDQLERYLDIVRERSLGVWNRREGLRQS
jgi:hypothetical protein